MTPGSSGSSRGKLWLWYCISLLLEARQPQVGDLGDVPTSYWNYLFWGSSLFLPCSALAANLSFSWWNGNLHLGWAADLQDWLSPQVCTRAAFPFVNAGAIWAFLPVGSDLYLMLRIICEHWLLFGHFCQWFWCLSAIEDRLWAWSAFGHSCQWVLTSDYRWGPFVSTGCHLGILPIASDIWLSLRTICVREVFGTLYRSPLERVYDRSVVWCVSVFPFV